MAVVGSRVTDDTPATPGDVRSRHAKCVSAIDKAEADLEKYFSRCEKIQKIYTEARREEASTRKRFSILWANVSTLQPATYARTPHPVVRRRFNDRDPLARQVSEVTERALDFQFDVVAFDETMRAVRDDFLLFARSTAWVRYEPKFVGGDDAEEGGDAEESDRQIEDERVPVDHIHYRDLIYPKARSWGELPWLARRVFMTREQLRKRFGREKADNVSLDHRPEGAKAANEETDKATVYEVWSKTDNRVFWVSRGHQEFLDESEPHLKLSGFFPCPKPAFGTLATNSLIPTPDYVYYEDQASQIDDATNRIAALTDQLKVLGFYPAGPSEEGFDAFASAIQGKENMLVPIPSMAGWSERGGVGGVQWWPIDQVVKVLRELYDVRTRLIQDVYQITGISDIVRGATDPRETKGAQQIKAQWGSIRIRDRQLELVRFAADLTKIMAEVISDKFQPETLLAMTGVELRRDEDVDREFQEAQAQWRLQAQQAQAAFQAASQAYQQQMALGPRQPGQPAPEPPQPPQMPPPPVRSEEITIDQVVVLMRDDRMRTFRIDIETDSTIEADENENKQRLTELTMTVTAFLEKALPAGQQYPELVPFMGQLLTTVVRGHRAGRQLEGAIEDVLAAAEKRVEEVKNAAPQGPQVPPEVQKAHAEIEADMAKFREELAAKAQQHREEMMIELRKHQAEMANRLEIERMRMQPLLAQANAPAINGTPYYGS